MTIPKRIFTTWLSESPIPAETARIIKTQQIFGYGHTLITLDNVKFLMGGCSPAVMNYIDKALKAKKWVKAADMLRAIFLYKYGGVYLDADVEILQGKNYDGLLDNEMFAAREENNFIGYSSVGSIPKHPIFKKYLIDVPERWKGDDDQFFQSSMEYFTHAVDAALKAGDKGIKILTPLYFFPFNHETGITKYEDYTISIHHFLKSWVIPGVTVPAETIAVQEIVTGAGTGGGGIDEGLIATNITPAPEGIHDGSLTSSEKIDEAGQMEDIKVTEVPEGTVEAIAITDLPKISFIIPHLNREDGLRKCLESIDNLNYPQELIEISVIGGDETVPEKMKKGVAETTGEYCCYAANDMTFSPDCVINAVKASQTFNKGLVSFNEGELLPDEGNICTHFIIRRDLIDKIGGEIFDCRMIHAGVDNLLWHKCKSLNEALYCKEAIIIHKHYSKGFVMDEVYRKGWSHADADRALLPQLIAEWDNRQVVE